MNSGDEVEERTGYLYRHVRLDTGEVFYVGIGFDNDFKRSRNTHNRNSFWKNIIDKTDYQIDIMLYDISKSLLFDKEKEFIALYGRRDLGHGTLVNLTNGGEGTLGSKLSEEHKLKISKSHLGKKFSEESIRKRSLSMNKKVIQKNLDGNIIKIWNSAKEANNEGFNNGHISSCCNGKLKTHKKFLWEFE